MSWACWCVSGWLQSGEPLFHEFSPVVRRSERTRNGCQGVKQLLLASAKVPGWPTLAKLHGAEVFSGLGAHVQVCAPEGLLSWPGVH